MPRVLNKIKKVSNIILRHISRRKWTYVILLSISIGILLIPQGALAGMGDCGFFEPCFWWDPGGWVDQFDGPVKNLFKALINSIGSIILAIISPFLALSKALLKWTISDQFISAGYLPSNNEVVATGWTTTRNLANMFFVVALVVIAMATALRYKEYQAQKLLPKLLIIALLINFTPVIAGVIIDASNVLMDHFLNQVNLNQGLVGKLTGIHNKIWQGFSDHSVGYNFKRTGLIIAFELTVTIIYFLYAFLFAVRPVAIWILIILSPLAFLAYIFPSTKQWWDQWWDQFLQWCFVGIAGAFFLYLAHETMSINLGATPSGSSISSEYKGFIDYISSYAVPLIFMYIGFVLAQKSGAIGADATINASKSVGKWGVGMAGKGARKGLEATGAPDRLRNRLEKMRTSDAPEPDDWEEMNAGQKLKSAAGSTFAPHSMRRAIGRAGSRQLNTPAQQVEELEEKYKGTDLGEKKSYFMGAANKQEKLAMMKAALKDGQLDTWKKTGLDANEIKDVLTKTGKVAPTGIKDLVENTPTIASDVKDVLNKEQEKKAGLTRKTDENGNPIYDSITTQVTAEMSPSAIENLSEETFEKAEKNPESDVAKGMTYWDGRQYSKGAQEFGSVAANAFTSAVKEKGVREFGRDNPSGYNYFDSNASRKWGLELPDQGPSGGSSSSGISSTSRTSSSTKFSSKDRNISDAEWERFDRTGDATQERLEIIAEQVDKGKDLKDREEKIYNKHEDEIKKIIGNL